jgi:hypothetical protein
VTVIIPDIRPAVLFMAVKAGIFPVPLVGDNPMDGLSMLHEYVAPSGVLVKAVAGNGVPEHTTMLAGTVTVGSGLTKISNVPAALTHPLTVAVTPYSPAIDVVIPGIVKNVSVLA